MKNIEDILHNKYLIISIIGEHAGESIEDIFSRKQKDVDEIGKTYWLIQSHKAKTETVQELSRKAEKEDISAYCLFIEPSQKGGAKPTLHDDPVTHVSSDNQNWNKLPNEIKITGKISRNSTALVFSELTIINNPTTIDLWEYSEFKTDNPVKMMLGASTICCEKRPSSGMKNRYRNVVGIGRLTMPYGVWLKK